MQINITGRHHHITQAMKDHAISRAEKLERYDDRITKFEITLNVEGQRNEAEVIASATGGNRLMAKEDSNDMYAAIDAAMDKMESQLKKNRSKIQDKRGQTKLGMVLPPEEPEERTYQEIVDDTDY